MARLRQTFEERFWSKVDKNGPVPPHAPELGPCWAWTGAKTLDGYGQIKLKTRKSARCHRASWELHGGVIPEGASVLHRCDNPSCVHPKHLFLGNQTANMRDMASKGRTATQFGDEHWSHQRPERLCRGEKHPWSTGDHARGEANTKARLTPEIVRAIRSAVPTYGYAVALARKYGISAGTVHSIRRGETWNHVE